jgi:orotidine-5'-phosphate decarboxylase
MPRSLILSPGRGAQGGSFEQLAECFGEARPRVLPSSSRGLLAHGPDRRALSESIREHCTRARDALG